MTALYILGGAICAAMWLGFLYFMVGQPIRAYLHRRELQLVVARISGRSTSARSRVGVRYRTGRLVLHT